MRILLFVFLMLSQPVSALDVSNVSFKNVHPGTMPGYVTTDIEFTISFRNLIDGTNNMERLRVQCTPSRDIWGMIYTPSGYIDIYAKNVRVDPTLADPWVTLNEMYQSEPQRQNYKVTLKNVIPGENAEIVIGFGGFATNCYSYDKSIIGRIPAIGPRCDITLQSSINHGTVTLKSIGDQHIANGAVKVTCDSSAKVTISTGHTGSVRINDAISTDISIDGVLNSVTRTINGIVTLPVASRLHRTSNSTWAGSFSKPVILTISLP